MTATSTLEKFKLETRTGIIEFIGTPVSNTFDYKSFAKDNGFYNMTINSPKNTYKYGGVGFVVYKNHNDSDEISYYNKKRLEVLFFNNLPVMYRIV